MDKECGFFYLVDWENGFIGGYDEEFTQQFNTPAKGILDVLKFYGVREFKIITPEELDNLRGYHKPILQESLGV